VPLVLEPVQRPHPPLWQGVVAPAAAEAAARRGANIVCTAGNAVARGVAERYLECWHGSGDAAAPLVGVLRNIYVAETDDEAVAVARPAYQAWYDSLVSLWRQFNSVPIRFHDTLDRALAHDAAIAGSPATVRAEVERHLAETGANYFVGRFAYGTLSHEQAARSLELFARDVMPHFTKD
jgi:alkanesulfonate monooxygenase SsuD/methylene tetrahydromethanopterin reductase-like flavin-dependent oxidoreductase (luciferase family)